MNIVKFSRDFIALGKKLDSYFKPRKYWSVKDFPVVVFSTNTVDKEYRFQAQIINWPLMGGTGETKKLALDDLSEKFKSYKTGHMLPRPGSKVPVQVKFSMPSREEYEKYYTFRVEFFEAIKDITLIKQILLITEYSKLADYRPYEISGAEKYKADIIKCIQEVYEIDVSGMYDGPLYDIFDLIMGKREVKA